MQNKKKTLSKIIRSTLLNQDEEVEKQVPTKPPFVYIDPKFDAVRKHSGL